MSAKVVDGVFGGADMGYLRLTPIHVAEPLVGTTAGE